MKKTVLGVVWLVAVGCGGAADGPKTEEVKKKVPGVLLVVAV